MNMTRIGVGSLVGLISLYILGYLFWEVLFAEFFAANAGSAIGVNRDEPIIWPIALGTLFYGILLTLAIDTRGDSVSLVDGLKVGALVGFLLWGTCDFILYGYMNLNTLTGAVADAVLEGVRGGVCGAVIAVTLNKLAS